MNSLQTVAGGLASADADHRLAGEAQPLMSPGGCDESKKSRGRDRAGPGGRRTDKEV